MLIALLVRAKDKWLEIQMLVHFTLTKADNEYKVRKLIWLKERSKVERNLSELRDIKSSLLTYLVITNW